MVLLFKLSSVLVGREAKVIRIGDTRDMKLQVSAVACCAPTDHSLRWTAGPLCSSDTHKRFLGSNRPHDTENLSPDARIFNWVIVKKKDSLCEENPALALLVTSGAFSFARSLDVV